MRPFKELDMMLGDLCENMSDLIRNNVTKLPDRELREGVWVPLENNLRPLKSDVRLVWWEGEWREATETYIYS